MTPLDPAAIPHRAPMHWVDAAYIDESGAAVTTRYIGASHPFVHEGKLLRSALIEMMAQAAACGSSYRAAGSGRVVRRGLLAAVRDLTYDRDVLAHQTVTLTARVERTAGPLTLCRTTARVNSVLVADARMTFHLEIV